ncbi:MAG: HpcH/HpaI aldolase/citrate lyase family protein [Marinilabiliaceae bacterium]|nr:HpcH/HpaI aldolase/citrate lyase family protein [Marinilabiliaceae bacterium]
MIATAGNRGDSIRSDCFIQLELKVDGGLHIELSSKVGVLYERAINELCESILRFYEIENAWLHIEDKGALPFTMAARLEACIKELNPCDKEYLFPILPQNKNLTPQDINRRSRLYLPGNNPKLMINAGIYGSDGIILDLEDSVAPDKKEEARYLVRNALRSVNFYGTERMVRINQIPAGLDDLDFIVPQPVNLILIPKCESQTDIVAVEQRIEQIKGQNNETIHLMPIIESALGVEKAFEIASASENVVALAIGLEDYTADLGAPRTYEARESFYARTAVVNAARAAGKQAIDSVFSDIGDMDALRANVKESKSLGFVGMGCIHPRQVAIINEGYSPDASAIEKAKRIVEAYHQAVEKGSGVVALGSKMIDPPVVKRALKIIDTAISTGQLDKDWRANND